MVFLLIRSHAFSSKFKFVYLKIHTNLSFDEMKWIRLSHRYLNLAKMILIVDNNNDIKYGLNFKSWFKF